MRLCHGNGNVATDGCCHVAGQVCPLRLLIQGGRVYEGPALTDLGTLTQFVNATFTGTQVRTRARDQLTGPRIACRAAVDVVAANAALLADRAALNAAWNAHAGYVAYVRPHWADLEQRLGLVPGSYQCSTWQGLRPGGECCFSETDVENETKRGALSAAAVQIRSTGGRA